MKKMFLFVLTIGATAAISSVAAADKNISEGKGADATFIKKAAIGGMTEVELGKVAEKNGKKDEVKSFGSQMVKDHGKANDNLKSVAGKMNAAVPGKVDAKHQAMIDKMSKLSGEAFDTAYVKAMVTDHEKDIAEFEKARGEVSNDGLKKFIDDTVPVMKEHLEMVKKMQQTK
jgi:putative membrane protein